MSEKQKQDQQQNPNAASDDSYSFYWNYSNQFANDKAQKKKQGNKGIFIYVTVLTCVFLVCFAMLAATVFLYEQGETGTTPPPSPAVSNTVAVSARVKPSVVLVQATSTSAISGGTGFILTADGYIVTNYHIVEGTEQIGVTFFDGKKSNAKLIGYRAEDDIAVLKVEGKGYPAVSIGNSDILLSGDVAIAIGNPGGAEGGWTTTQGIISATNRTISIEETAYFSEMKMLQTDAQVNPGNSGGPLCNASGEVIGIITRKLPNYEGIGYAIPINEAMQTIDAIINGKLDGFVSSVSQSRPKVGITGAAVEKGYKFQLELEGEEYTTPVPGFLVTEVSKNNGAYGIVQIGDLICGVNGKTITDFETFKTELYKCYVGQKVTFDIYRRNQKMTVEITLGVS